MKKLNMNVTPVVAAVLALNCAMATVSFAGQNSSSEAQASISDNDSSVIENQNELKIYYDANGNLVNEVADLEQSISDANPRAAKEYVRIQKMNTASNKGKTIIIVHEGNTNEYLEVFTQEDEEGKVLTPVNIFKDNTTNISPVSTAGTFSGKQYVTPAGDFKFDSFQTMHHSQEFNDAPMPFAMFFNSGIAIHGLAGNEIKMIGKPASHGCVRTPTENAEALFNYITPANKQNAVVEILAPVKS
jgi:lipoprotein-anchoring transpeptidase ErfK/SrfK